MNTRKTLSVLLLGSALLATGLASAQDRRDPGRREYRTSCAACHGAEGKGDGPLAASLNKPPVNLTLLAQRNGGVFPAQHVQQVIDGRTEVKPHGSREMPVWGERFTNQGSAEYFDVSFNSEAYVAARIMVLSEYLSRIQVK